LLNISKYIGKQSLNIGIVISDHLNIGSWPNISKNCLKISVSVSKKKKKKKKKTGRSSPLPVGLYLILH